MSARAARVTQAAVFQIAASTARSNTKPVQVATPPAPVSAGTLSAMLDGRPCDPHAFRRVYPDQWRAFLHAHFRSHAHVAVFFDVDAKSARNWWDGTTGPQGWAVAFALHSIEGRK